MILVHVLARVCRIVRKLISRDDRRFIYIRNSNANPRGYALASRMFIRVSAIHVALNIVVCSIK